MLFCQGTLFNVAVTLKITLLSHVAHKEMGYRLQLSNYFLITATSEFNQHYGKGKTEQ